MPAYNAEKYIRQSIDSILNQSLSHFILLVIDDGSVDSTEKIIRSYNDDRIVYVKNEQNIGVKETLNKGLLMADTEYIARMDADDIAVPERLKWQLEFMDTNKEIGVSGGSFEIFGDENTIVKMPLKDEEIKAKLFFFSGFCHPTIILRREILINNNMFYGSPIEYPDTFGHKVNEMEDFGLWHRLKHLTQFGNIDKVLVKYRKGEQNISRKSIGEVHKRKKMMYYYLLNEIGIIDPPEDEILFLFTLQYFKDDPETVKIKKYKLFLNKLIEENKFSQIYDVNQFEYAVNKVWNQFFYFTTTLNLTYSLSYWRVSKEVKKDELMYLLKFKIKYIFKN
jgi:glycosyltransferase involved in cell wall biosynthesis